jgi:tRNA-2-methylthio-N6-dimethylallyladenosine synthase
MNRTYTKEWYLHKVDRIREILPGCALSTDIITGFCTETEEDHQETLLVMDYCHYDLAYMYAYSERPGTLAARRYEDDVTNETKSRRLNEIIERHREQSLTMMALEMGKQQDGDFPSFACRYRDVCGCNHYRLYIGHITRRNNSIAPGFG